MPEIVLNGQRLQVPEDKPLLEIVRGEGIRVPSLCYHPALSPAGCVPAVCGGSEIAGQRRTDPAVLRAAREGRDGNPDRFRRSQ